MKKINLFVILLAAILMPFLIISCNNDEINNPSFKELIVGSWSVTSYIDEGEYEGDIYREEFDYPGDWRWNFDADGILKIYTEGEYDGSYEYEVVNDKIYSNFVSEWFELEYVTIKELTSETLSIVLRDSDEEGWIQVTYNFRRSGYTGDEGNTGDGSTKDFVYTETGMYLGITGFSDEINFYGNSKRRYETLSNSHSYEAFIDDLSMGDATVLYYAVDNNLSYLERCQFPNDVSSVSIITFTDGLDQGSRALDKQDQNNSYAADSKSYVEAIAEKLQRIKVNNLPINAYAIGVRGSDVQGDAVTTFENNLLKLSSSAENAMQVSNMDEVNAKFEAIAKSLYSKTETRSLNITIPMPSEKEKERFTFDNVTDPTKSTCYLEGIYAGGALNDIQYVGCQSSSGAKVLETSAGGVKIQFVFENFTDLNGNAISTNNMQQWHMNEGETTWTRNSEFKPTESINVEETRTSAVVMLILDCSSSLGTSDFSKVKTAAKNFIKNLAGEVNDNSSDNNLDDGSNNDDDNQEYPTLITCEEAVDMALNLPVGSQSTEEYEVVGYVTRLVGEYNTEYGDQTFWMADTKGDEEVFYAYQCYIDRPVSVGDYVSINGKLLNYNGTPEMKWGRVTILEENTSSNYAKVRFQKTNDYSRVTGMYLFDETGENILIGQTFGSGSGISSYYEIPSGYAYPVMYYIEDLDTEEGGYYYMLDKPYYYYFEAGYKYTVVATDDGNSLVFYVTQDGVANAPAKVVATRRVPKNELHTLKKAKL